MCVRVRVRVHVRVRVRVRVCAQNVRGTEATLAPHTPKTPTRPAAPTASVVLDTLGSPPPSHLQQKERQQQYCHWRLIESGGKRRNKLSEGYTSVLFAAASGPRRRTIHADFKEVLVALLDDLLFREKHAGGAHVAAQGHRGEAGTQAK